MRETYLRESRPELYNEYIAAGELVQHLTTVDKIAQSRFDLICTDLATKEGLAEDRKLTDYLGWVRQMGNIRNRARESVLSELIYI